MFYIEFVGGPVDGHVMMILDLVPVYRVPVAIQPPTNDLEPVPATVSSASLDYHLELTDRRAVPNKRGFYNYVLKGHSK